MLNALKRPVLPELVAKSVNHQAIISVYTLSVNSSFCASTARTPPEVMPWRFVGSSPQAGRQGHGTTPSNRIPVSAGISFRIQPIDIPIPTAITAIVTSPQDARLHSDELDDKSKCPCDHEVTGKIDGVSFLRGPCGTVRETSVRVGGRRPRPPRSAHLCQGPPRQQISRTASWPLQPVPPAHPRSAEPTTSASQEDHIVPATHRLGAPSPMWAMRQSQPLDRANTWCTRLAGSRLLRRSRARARRRSSSPRLPEAARMRAAESLQPQSSRQRER